MEEKRSSHRSKKKESSSSHRKKETPEERAERKKRHEERKARREAKKDGTGKKSRHRKDETPEERHERHKRERQKISSKSKDKSKAKDTSKDESKKKGAGKMKNFHDDYVLGKEIGRGAFSVVMDATNKKTKVKVAVKCIKQSVVQGDYKTQLAREVEILKSLDHPNILRLLDVYEDADQVYIITELVEGKELFDKIIERGNYSESEAAHTIKQVVQAIAYLHDKDIAHRDLKPENILSSGDGVNEIVKVADFGLSKNFDEDKLQTRCGSPSYVAPEVLTGNPYDRSVDMWSVGVILYVLLVGFPPFFADNDPQLFKKIMTVEYDFDYEEWDSISSEAKDLIRKLLLKEPGKRLTAKQMLADPWFTVASTDTRPLQLQKLKQYQTMRTLENK